MPKHNDDTSRSSGAGSTSDAPAETRDNTLEQHVVAFAEQLGRIAGTVHARAAGWMDREALTRQIASVRDGAAQLLEHLARGPAETALKAPAGAAAPGTARGRSGGVVDAPGKKHRKPLPSNPGASKAASQTAKMRAARTMVKTPRRRGRG